MFRNIFIIFLALSSLQLLVGCFNDKVAGSSSTGNAETAIVSGFLYKETGDPAAGAKVVFIPVAYNPYTGQVAKITANADSISTNDSGWYGTNDLAPGKYNIYGQGKSGDLCLIDSVTITGDTQVVESGTVKEPGSLSGFIKLLPGDEPDKIIAIVMGSNSFSFVNDDAGFSFPKLAEGEYWVKFFSTLDEYSNLDTNFTIKAGEALNLPDSIVIPLRIPVPTGFTVNYDTATQIVTLSWDKMDTAKVMGYNVYRQHEGDADSMLTPVPITDTFFVDSTGIQNETYAYRVASFDLSNEIGLKTEGINVTISTFFIIDTVYNGLDFDPGQFQNPNDIAIAENGDIYLVEQNGRRILNFDENMVFKAQIGAGFLNRSNNITLDNYNYAYITVGYDSIFVFDTNEALIDTILINGIFDIEYKNENLFVVTQGESLSVLSSSGDLKTNWQCGNYNCVDKITVTDSNVILVSDHCREKILKYDTSGTMIGEVDVSPYPHSIAYRNGMLFVNTLSGTKGNSLKVLDMDGNLKAEYKFPEFSEPSALSISLDGQIYELFRSDNKIVKLYF